MNQNDDEDGFLEKTGPKRQSNSNETGAISTVGFALRSESVENPRAALKSNYGLKKKLCSVLLPFHVYIRVELVRIRQVCDVCSIQLHLSRRFPLTRQFCLS